MILIIGLNKITIIILVTKADENIYPKEPTIVPINIDDIPFSKFLNNY